MKGGGATDALPPVLVVGEPSSGRMEERRLMMAKTTAREYTAAAHALAKLARQRSIPYVLGGMSLKGMDCQGLCEYLLTECVKKRKKNSVRRESEDVPDSFERGSGSDT